MSNLFSFVFLLLLSFKVMAKSEQYQLKGSFQLDSSVNKPIKYLLSWSEEDGEIKGTYSDNYFTNRAKVVGVDASQGRTFTVKLPEAKRGIQTMSILLSAAGSEKIATTIPVSIITRDTEGNPLTNASEKAKLSATRLLAQKQEEVCQEGFGALAGYCGIYEGLIAETVDRQNKCNLLFADSVKLEFDADANLTLYLGPVEEVFDSPGHLIGRVPSNHGSNRVDIMSRTCRNIVGVESKSEYCKRLNLIGQFSVNGNKKHFSGTYTIFDEGTKNTCRYTLSMDE